VNSSFLVLTPYEGRSRQDGSEDDVKRADDALDSGKLEGVEALFVSGIGISGKLKYIPRKYF
jgi:hypothetical protein